MGCAFVHFFCSFSLICTVHLALRTCNFCAKVVLCALSIFIHSCIPVSLTGCSSYCITITLESGLAQDAVPPDCLTRHCSWKIYTSQPQTIHALCVQWIVKTQTHHFSLLLQLNYHGLSSPEVPIDPGL